MIRNLTNISASNITLTDFAGIVIAAGATIDGLSMGESALKASNDIAINILNGNLTVSDGTATYATQSALDLIQNNGGDQRTIDGKRIITASDRPKDTYRCFMGRGDDLTTNPATIGTGPSLVFNVAPGQTSALDMKFKENVFVKDGTIRYLGASMDSFLDVWVICPPNTPYPDPTHTGSLDYVNGQFVANTTNTGAYTTSTAETPLFHFINTMHLLGDDRQPIESPEPFQIVYPYFLRFIVTNSASNTVNIQAGVMVGLYRSHTM